MRQGLCIDLSSIAEVAGVGKTKEEKEAIKDLWGSGPVQQGENMVIICECGEVATHYARRGEWGVSICDECDKQGD